MNQIVNSEYDCKDCKFFDGHCKVYGLNTPRVCGDFEIKEYDDLMGGEDEYI